MKKMKKTYLSLLLTIFVSHPITASSLESVWGALQESFTWPSAWSLTVRVVPSDAQTPEEQRERSYLEDIVVQPLPPVCSCMEPAFDLLRLSVSASRVSSAFTWPSIAIDSLAFLAELTGANVDYKYRALGAALVGVPLIISGDSTLMLAGLGALTQSAVIATIGWQDDLLRRLGYTRDGKKIG